MPQSRFGFSIKKALGGAVGRNRMRRRMREIVRCQCQEIPAGWDIVIHPKSATARAPFATLTADLLRLLQNGGGHGEGQVSGIPRRWLRARRKKMEWKA